MCALLVLLLSSSLWLAKAIENKGDIKDGITNGNVLDMLESILGTVEDLFDKVTSIESTIGDTPPPDFPDIPDIDPFPDDAERRKLQVTGVDNTLLWRTYRLELALGSWTATTGNGAPALDPFNRIFVELKVRSTLSNEFKSLRQKIHKTEIWSRQPTLL